MYGFDPINKWHKNSYRLICSFNLIQVWIACHTSCAFQRLKKMNRVCTVYGLVRICGAPFSWIILNLNWLFNTKHKIPRSVLCIVMVWDIVIRLLISKIFLMIKETYLNYPFCIIFKLYILWVLKSKIWRISQ